MKLDAKQTVLISVYSEYQKDLPDYQNALKSNTIGLSQAVIETALRKLQNEGLITDFETRTSLGKVGKNINRIMLTTAGQKYVEDKLSIEQNASGQEKIETVSSSAIKYGWEEIKDVAAKVIAEMLKK